MLGAAGVSVYPPPRRCPYGRHRRGSGARAVPTAMRRCCTAAMTSSTHVIAELRLAVLREHVIETWSVGCSPLRRVWRGERDGAERLKSFD